MGGDSPSVLAAGLPNITGYFNGKKLTDNDDIASGAFQIGGAPAKLTPNCPDDEVGYGFNFDASRSNPIYGASTTVQPPTIQLIPQIKY